MLKIISSIYLVVLLILSLYPLSGVDSAGHSDKIAHFVAYTILSALAYFLSSSNKNRLYLLGSVILLGILLEALQLLIPGRNFSYLDMAANIGGALFGFGLSMMVLKSREQPRFGGCGSPYTTVPVKHAEENKPQ